MNIFCEQFRPGVMEHLNLCPQQVHRVNPKCIYVRISGYGRDAPEETIQRGGRDINYVAQSGLLAKFKRTQKQGTPALPTNTLTYAAAGALSAFTKILAVLHSGAERVVVDCNLSL